MLNRPLVFLGHGENMVKTAAYASFKWSCFSPFCAKHHLANGMFLHLPFPFSQLEFHVVLKNDLGPKGAVKQRSEEHTSELQSRGHLVCRLLLEKKKKKKQYN